MSWSFSWSGLACDYDPSLVASSGEDKIYGGIVQDLALHLLEPLGQRPISLSAYGHSVIGADGKAAQGTTVSVNLVVLPPPEKAPVPTETPQAPVPADGTDGNVQPPESPSEHEGDPQEAVASTPAAPEPPPAPVSDQPSQQEA